jgi:hypothetical protein
MFLLKASLLTALNTPWIEPSLSLAYRPIDYIEFGQRTSATCVPTSVTRWSPSTAHWDVYLAGRLNNITLSLGHISNHGIQGSPLVKLQSLDYVKLEYERKL